MRRTHTFLFSKNDEPSPGQSGGRGSESQPPATDIPGPVAGGFLPLDSPDPKLPIGSPVTFCFEKGEPATGFKDPVYGFMDARGVLFPEGVVPNGWKPL